jgi:transcriptional regulator with XRE-family HTH domain
MADAADIIANEARALKLRQELGAIFLEIRTEEGYTQRQMAEKIGCPQYMISRLENGNIDLKLSNLQKYMAAFGYNLEVGFIPMDE